MGDDGDGGQLLTMPAERAAHREDPPAGVTVNEHVPGEPQRSEKPFVGDQSARL